jgi:hypothetical protein
MRRFVEYKPWLALAAAAVLSVGVAACGGDDNGSASGGGNDGATAVKGSGVGAGSGSRAETAKKAGEQAATEAGDAITLDKKTIGIINFLGGIESSDRLKSTAQKAAEKLGWDSKVCDGKGTPTVFVTCGNSLLDQKVDAIVEIAIDAAPIRASRAARSRPTASTTCTPTTTSFAAIPTRRPTSGHMARATSEDMRATSADMRRATTTTLARRAARSRRFRRQATTTCRPS